MKYASCTIYAIMKRAASACRNSSGMGRCKACSSCVATGAFMVFRKLLGGQKNTTAKFPRKPLSTPLRGVWLDGMRGAGMLGEYGLDVMAFGLLGACAVRQRGTRSAEGEGREKNDAHHFKRCIPQVMPSLVLHFFHSESPVTVLSLHSSGQCSVKPALLQLVA